MLETAQITGFRPEVTVRYDQEFIPVFYEELTSEDSPLTTYDEKHPGFLPREYRPELFGTSMNAVLAWYAEQYDFNTEGRQPNHSNMLGVDIDVENQDSALEVRPDYHEKVPRSLRSALDLVSRAGVYNQVLVNSHREPFDLHRIRANPETRGVLHQVENELGSGRLGVILPFVDKESGTVPNVSKYAADKVGASNVLAVHVGHDYRLTEEVREIVPTVEQSEIFQAVNWNTLKEAGVLPANFPLSEDGIPKPHDGEKFFSKGMTMYAAALVLEAVGKLDTQLQAFHDTDIVNPNRYAALEHIGVALAEPVTEDPNAYYVLRTGEGRNNETVTYGFNEIAKRALLAKKMREEGLDHLDVPEERFNRMIKLSMALSALGWPLTGERAGKFREAPFSTGMGIETTLNFYFSGMDVDSGVRKIMQVANPNQKEENASSPRAREFSLIYQCASWGELMADYSFRTGRLPHEWSTQDIGKFNKLFGGKPKFIGVPNDGDNLANEHSLIRNEFMLPSMQQLRDDPSLQGAVDWDKIAQIYRESNQHHL